MYLRFRHRYVGNKSHEFPKGFGRKGRDGAEIPPNQLDPEKVTEHMGICVRHWPTNFKTKKKSWWPVDPPTSFGTTPSSFHIQTGNFRDRSTDKRRVTNNDVSWKA